MELGTVTWAAILLEALPILFYFLKQWIENKKGEPKDDTLREAIADRDTGRIGDLLRRLPDK